MSWPPNNLLLVSHRAWKCAPWDRGCPCTRFSIDLAFDFVVPSEILLESSNDMGWHNCHDRAYTVLSKRVKVSKRGVTLFGMWRLREVTGCYDNMQHGSSLLQIWQQRQRVMGRTNASGLVKHGSSLALLFKGSKRCWTIRVISTKLPWPWGTCCMGPMRNIAFAQVAAVP